MLERKITKKDGYDYTEKTATKGQLSDIENFDECGIINDNEFNESDHPRDENGQFTDGGSASEGGSQSKGSKESGKEKGNTLSLNVQLFAKVPTEKFTEYCLNPDKASDKAIVFKSALGYTLKNAKQLQKDIEEKFDESKCKIKGKDKFGTRLEQIMKLKGPNGKIANVCTAWIKETDDSEPRLVSCYIVKREE
ncbi:MAG: DUF6883 domain-containing protein [Acutalibacteraceae bacterium]